MANITHTFTKTLYDGSTSISNAVAITSGQDIRIDEDLGVVTNQLVTFAFTRAKLQSIYMVSDVACSVYTNAASTGSPQETISLVANKPWQWDNTDGSAVTTRFGGNVTALYVTTTVATHLTVRALVDPT